MKKLSTLALMLLSLTFGVKATQTTYKMVKADYQTIVDSVKNNTTWASYDESTYGNSEYYFGASAYKSNFDIEDDGSWENTVFSSWEDAVQAALTKVFLPKTATDATTEDTIKITFDVYDGDNSATIYYMPFVCTKAAPDPEFAKIAVSEDAKIGSFKVDGQYGEALIDNENLTVSIQVLEGTDITNVKPEASISYGATISDTSIAKDFSSPVTYVVTAQDGTTKDTWTVNVSTYEDDPTSIYDIQYVEDLTTVSKDSSKYTGKTVVVVGVITAVKSTSSANYIYIQNTTGPWNGVYIYDKTGTSGLSKGDSIKVVGVVDEYFELTEIKPSSVTILGSKKTLPEAYEVTGALDESLEGVYVTIHGVTLATDDDDTDYSSLLFLVAGLNGTSIKISSEMLPDDANILPEEGKIYNIKGVVAYSRSHYRICPRSTSDVEVVATNSVKELTLNNAVNVYPNPCYSTLNLEGFNGQVSIVNVLGQTVKVVESAQEQINVSDLKSGIYYVKAENQVVRFLKK